MAWVKGTATTYRTLLEDIVDFAIKTTKAELAVASYGAIIGDGTLDSLNIQVGAPDEDWTIEATGSPTLFSVTGSVSGVQLDATVGTPYDNSIIDFTLTAGGTAFVTGDAFKFGTVSEVAGSVSTQGLFIGDGTVISQSSTKDSVLETFLITCTTAGASAIFSVTGSVTGSLPIAHVNTTYSESHISFVISGGTTDFVLGDTFTIEVTTEGAKWSVNRLVNTPGSEYEVLLQGVGHSGTDEIFVGMQTWNTGIPKGLRVSGFTGYNGASTFINQPGAAAINGTPNDDMYVATADVNIVYWINASPQRIMCTILSGTSYGAMYIGWINQYASPSQYLYPMMVGYSSQYDYMSYTDDGQDSYWNSSTTRVILSSTGWKGAGTDNNYMTMTLTTTDLKDILFQEDGSVPHFPAVVVLNTLSEEAVYGELEGLTLPATSQEFLTVEDLILETDTSYMVVQDTLATGTLALFQLEGDQ